jgi:hypothetical protein
MDEEETITLAKAQAHKDLAEGDKFQIDARVGLLQELRLWLTAHRLDEQGIAGEQQAFPLVERGSKEFNQITKKVLDIIEAL